MPQLTKYENFEALKSQPDAIVLNKKDYKEAFAEFENMLTFFRKHIQKNDVIKINMKTKKVNKGDK